MKNIIKIIKISKPLHGILAILAVLIVLSSSLQLVSPILSKFIVDEIVASIQGQSADLNRLIFLVVLSFVTGAISVGIMTISNRLGDHFSGKLRQFLTEKFYEKVLTLPQSYFDSELSGRIVNQLNRGIFTIYNFLNSASNFVVPMMLQSIFTVIVLAYYNIPIAFFTFLLFPIYLTLSWYSTKKWGEEEAKKNIIEDINRGRINEVISNIRLVKGFTNESNEYGFVSSSLSKINKIYAKQSSTYHKVDFLRNFSLILVLFGVNILVFYNTFIGNLTIGEMVLIIQLFVAARTPLSAMSYILTQVQTAEKGSAEYLKILDLESTENFTEHTKTKLIEKPKIRFENVSFKYEESDIVLNKISFEISHNEKVALVGHSGAGKSTVVNLILKLYRPIDGELYIKDKAYSSLSTQEIRNNIALVFQENELFSSTVAENVSYGKPEATRKEIINALKLANAYDFVKKLPKGIDSEIGERGVKLSGGQKQRVQIARAIIKNAPILILDEATSSLDAKNEREVQVALDNLMKDKLVIIIAHRFTTIQNVNKIIVIENGSVANYGTPQELAKQKGVYSELLNYQIEGNKKLLESYEIY